MSMKYIREHNGIPVKKGMEVYHSATGFTGHISSCKGGRVNFKTVTLDLSVHPFDLDYLVGEDRWIEGAQKQREFNRRIDNFNQRLNKQKYTVR
jgi:ribosomal protein L31